MEMLEENWKWYRALELTEADLWYFRSGDWLKEPTEETVMFITARETKFVLAVGETITVNLPT